MGDKFGWVVLPDDQEKRIEAAFTQLIGEDSYRALWNERGAVSCLSHARPVYRSLGLNYFALRSGQGINSDVLEAIVELARSDPHEVVRCQAIHALSAVCVWSFSRELLQLFARLALDEQQPDTVRAAAYSSAVLCEPDVAKKARIVDYTHSNPDSFDREFLLHIQASRGQTD